LPNAGGQEVHHARRTRFRAQWRPLIDNGVIVNGRVWRGAAPTAAGYRALVATGVSTVVDLRSDSERGTSVDVLDALDVETVQLPIRDGQLPTSADVTALSRALDSRRRIWHNLT
jgi:hypothetical protein